MRVRDVGGALGHGLRDNGGLIALCLVELAAARGLATAYGLTYENRFQEHLLMLLGSMMPFYLLVMVLWTKIGIARRRPPVRPHLALLAEAKGALSDLPRMASGLVALFTFTAFIGAFSFVKGAIPDIQPFAWDSTLAEVDRTLHGGTDPYRITMAVFGNPFATTMLNAAYHGWLLLVFTSVLTACFTGVNPAARRIYLLSFLLVWGLGGNLVALLFASAGPCYYGALGLGDDFAPLMQTLRQFDEVLPVWALRVQDMLWTDLGGHQISAFPSMHVASTTLVMFYAFTWRRWAGHAMVLFLGLIMAGSVQLGWHYAVDGYAGAALAAATWFAVRRLVVGPARRPVGTAHPVAP